MKKIGPNDLVLDIWHEEREKEVKAPEEVLQCCAMLDSKLDFRGHKIGQRCDAVTKHRGAMINQLAML